MKISKEAKLIAGAVFVVVILFSGVTVLINNLKEDFDRSEVRQPYYDVLREWIKQYPTIKPRVNELMNDGKITNREFELIQDARRDAKKDEFQRELESTKQFLME